MEEKKKLTKGMQILMGIIIGVMIYGLFFLTLNFVTTIFGVITMLSLPIIIIFSAIKLMRGVTYKVLGITIIAVASPILIFGLVAGACFSFFTM